MINKSTHQLIELCKRVKKYITELMHDLFGKIKAGWAKHRDQVSTNAAYATALGAAATAVVELFTHDPALLGVVTALVAVYVAIHRAAHPDPWRPSSDQWRSTTDPWDDRHDWR